jgi:hypothetical protein
MGKKSFKKHQKVYRMKGCSKQTRKNHLGGSADINLAYPASNIKTVSNPFLAYTGKGGALALPVNTNGVNKTIPSTGPATIVPATPFLNSQTQRGGTCGTCGVPFMKGGKKRKGGCGPLCAVGFMVGGTKHRVGCKCSTCKLKQSGGNPGIPYPNGLVGAPWTPSPSGWPGVDGVQGGRNYLAPNNYQTDVQTSIISTGANPPFSVGGKRRKQKGGTLSNFISQDFINLGRQFQFGLGSAYNALSGYSAPASPLPWKGQLPNTASLSTVKTFSY